MVYHRVEMDEKEDGMKIMNELELARKEMVAAYEDLSLMVMNPTPHFGAKLHEVVLKLKSSTAILENVEDKIYSERVS